MLKKNYNGIVVGPKYIEAPGSATEVDWEPVGMQGSVQVNEN